MSLTLSIDNIESRVQSSQLQKSYQQYDTQKTTNGALVRKFLLDQSESNWNAMATGIQEFLSSVSEEVFPGARVLICTAEGKVAYDSAKNNNSYENFLIGLIGDNHNTRISILTALQDKSGYGFEVKVSGVVGKTQIYNAVRMGVSTDDSFGTTRVSYNKRA